MPPARAASVEAIGPVMISSAEPNFRRTAERDITPPHKQALRAFRLHVGLFLQHRGPQGDSQRRGGRNETARLRRAASSPFRCHGVGGHGRQSDRHGVLAGAIEVVALRKQARRCVRRSGAARAIMRPAPARRDRRDSDVAKAITACQVCGRSKQSFGRPGWGLSRPSP